MRFIKASTPLLLFAACVVAPAVTRAEDPFSASPLLARSPGGTVAVSLPAAPFAFEPVVFEPAAPSVQAAEPLREASRKAWAWSLAPLVASQSLDAASSYGYRELNPMLADPDGAFGVKAVAIKFAVVGALIGVEYLILRKSPRSSRILALLNWSGAGVTAGLAVHNYAVR